jgi:hypothetical protein
MLDRPWTDAEQARVDDVPPPPNLWEPGQHAVSVWDLAAAGYRTWTADPDTGEPIRPLADVPEQDGYWEGLVGSAVPKAEIRVVEPLAPLSLSSSLTIERLSPRSWRVDSLLAGFIFRNVKVTHTPSADVEVFVAGMRVLTTPITLSLTGRRELAKEIDARAGGLEPLDYWKRACDLAFEAILDTVRSLGDITDISNVLLDPKDRALWVLEGLVTVGANSLIAPGAFGKSTIARAACVSVASGRVVMPGVIPRVTGPVLYVVSEDANVATHVSNINRIKQGAGITGELAYPIEWLPTVGQPLHQIAQSIAERARDHAMVVLDAQSGLMASSGYAGIRNEATEFHNDIDSLGRPVLLIGHPAMNGSINWNESDGRSAGSEIHRDRVRMAHAMWRKRLEPAVGSPPISVVKVACTKFNDGPEGGAIFLTMQWDEDTIAFMAGDEALWMGAGKKAAGVGGRKPAPFISLPGGVR